MIKKKLADTKNAILGLSKGSKDKDSGFPAIADKTEISPLSSVKQALQKAQNDKKEEAKTLKKKEKEEKKRQEIELKNKKIEAIQSNNNEFQYVSNMLRDAAEQLKDGEGKDYKVVERIEPEKEQCEWFLLKGSSALRYLKAAGLGVSGTIIGIGSIALAAGVAVDTLNNDMPRTTHHYSNRLDKAGMPDPTETGMKAASTSVTGGMGLAESCFEKAEKIIKDYFLHIKINGSTFVLECGDESVSTSSLKSAELEKKLIGILQKNIG